MGVVRTHLGGLAGYHIVLTMLVLIFDQYVPFELNISDINVRIRIGFQLIQMNSTLHFSAHLEWCVTMM
jgi:hypothetical protein